MEENSVLLEVENLKTYFTVREGIIRAVDGVSFSVRQGQTVGLVGESGCGKSVTARSILRIEPRTGKIVEGAIRWHRQTNGATATPGVTDLAQLNKTGPEMRAIRGSEIAMIFQEPMASLSPVHTIGFQICEGILLHRKVTKAQARAVAIETLERCGMPQPTQTIDRYPHQLSGGMRQRAMIAIALACNPQLLIADEPTTALDVTTQAQILSLMRQLQRELGMAILFITHDLGVIAKMTEYVLVMYLGKVVEAATVQELFRSPKHPYTEALLQSIPQLGRRSGERLAAIPGSVPDPFSAPPGCPFHPRCHRAIAGLCDQQEPPLVEVAPGHTVRCVLYTP
ncbi:MAG: dipeptide/oligopeptide/nickel ABC transporter ATP-binding protein [Chloroflexi bacterium]|nr:MAG: dipeptide/oligopeptide/nickel ABC transporter ATP-binding protein [Chloroflexota bacterium]